MASYNHANLSIDADMENFLDFNGGGGMQSPSSAVDPLHSLIAPEHADERQVFSGPSHEYGRFRQQTGLPSGAMSTIASLSDMSGDNDFMSQNSTYTNNSNYGSSVDIGYNSGFNLDMDYEPTPQSALPAYFYPGVSPGEMNEFGEPSPAGAYDTPPANPPRLWPGMHSQQAEQARVEATARQQRQQQQGQQIMQQRQREQSMSASSQHSLGSRKSRAGSHANAGTAADEHISRILDHMRHNSTISTIDEEQNEADDDAARSAKLRREEDDMDEDERLLASEEGKKLSSKERRQLRNKVSARAFRSRRKEYITQLEGEVAAKANECNELRLNSRKLAEENSQLKHLTRTLLSHPAFQTFLEDMSRDPTFIGPQAGSVPSNETEQGGVITKQEDTSDSNNSQSKAPRIPQTLDISMLNLGNSHWGAGNTGFNFQQPQVFAVLEVPEGPSHEEIMAPRISGKSCEARVLSSRSSVKNLTVPQPIEVLARPDLVTNASSTLEEDEDVCYSLYAADPPCSSCPSTCTIEITTSLIEYSASCKKSSSHHPVTISKRKQTETLLEEVEALFESSRASLKRIEQLTWHLPRS